MSVFINDPFGREGAHFANTVQEQTKAEKSKLLGPDGKALSYEKQRIGFDLTKKSDKNTEGK